MELHNCPNCKSDKIYLEQEREDNGILGSGYASWVKNEYYVCKNCGIMFKNIKRD